MQKRSSILVSELILLLAAMIWGFAFVAQKAGMDSLGPFAFNGIRFLMGSVSLLPVLYLRKGTPSKKADTSGNIWYAGLFSGTILFFAASTQQFGIVFTTAGNAGFITSLYVILVPILGLFLGQKVNIQTWIASVFAVVGLFYLSASEGVAISFGNLLVLGSAFVWAVQVILAGYYSKRFDIFKLALIQFTLTGLLSLIISFFTETYNWQNIYDALIPLLYGGVMSVGVAFTLQLYGQQKAIPSHAAIILSTESVFAAIGGWLILSEKFTGKEYLGAGLMLAGIILSQIRFNSKKNRRP